MKKQLSKLDQALATAILGIDTLFGGDVNNPSGMGRFLADCWFSDLPMPAAYTHPLAAKLRESGGVSAKKLDREAIHAYKNEIDIRGAIREVSAEARKISGVRGASLKGRALALEVIFDLILEILGEGEPVPYERCMRAATGLPPEPSDPTEKQQQLAELLNCSLENLQATVQQWRRERIVPNKAIRALSDAFIAELDAHTVQNFLPFMPAAIREVPRANIEFLPIENAWFSGSMNYLGRKRKRDGSPEYEATYEINASLEISVPEFQQLISHEVVPGHVTTSAYLQNLYIRKKIGFEASVQTMNTREATLAEGIANNGILMAYGVNDIEDLPTPDLKIGVLLALLQDDAKNQASYLTWQEKLPQAEVKTAIRDPYLLSEERSEKFSGAWGRHPLMGRMNLPAYRAGTQAVAKLRKKYPPKKVLPALFGCNGLVDVVTVRQVL